MAENIVIKIFADDRTKKAFSSVGKSLSVITKAAAAMGAATAVATTALTAKSLKSADALAKMADKIGASTEALAGLQYAAELSGVSTETMNMALQRMTRRVSEAAMGTGEAKAALFELGLNAKELEQLPLDQQMGMIADAMQNVGSQADRVRIAMKLFDSEGVALVNTLQGGSEELARLAEEANVLGLALSRADTAKIEAANDAIYQAQQVFTGLGNQLATAFAPIIAALATDFRQAAVENAELGNVGQRVANAVVGAIWRMLDAWTGMKVIMMQVKVAGYELGAALVGSLSDVGGAIDSLIEAYNYLANSAFGKGIGLEPITAGVERSILETQQSLINSAVETQNAVVEILSQGKPSDHLVAEYQRIQAEATKTAEVVATAAEGMSSSTEQKTQEQVESESKLAEFMAMSERDKTMTVLNEATTRFAGVAANSKKLFALQKGMQIAQAIMNTYTSATKTMAEYPFPVNVALAAMTVASGMAQVAQIRAQSFDGGGFTGYGARAGGVDGKGGFPAILHPNETVVDHTKGQGMGNVTFNVQANDARGFDELLIKRRSLIVNLVNQAANNNGRRAVA